MHQKKIYQLIYLRIKWENVRLYFNEAWIYHFAYIQRK